MKKSMGRLVAAAAVFTAGFVIQAPAWADPPPWAPAHGQRAKQHKYVYYPTREVYYAPEQKTWFWLNAGSWQFGASLPVQYRPQPRTGVVVLLDTERPYERHQYVEERHGKHKNKQKKHKNKKHKHDD